MGLTIDKQVNDGNVVLTLDGRIDAGTVAGFREQTLAAVSECTGNVILECEKLEYVSSIGLRVFLTAKKELQKNGGMLQMSHVQEPIMRILRMTGFDTFIKII